MTPDQNRYSTTSQNSASWQSRIAGSWVIVGLAILILTSSVGYDIWDDRAIALKNEQERLLTQSRVIEANLEQQAVAIREILQSIARDHTNPKAESRLTELSKAIPGVRTLLILDKDGKVVTSTRKVLVGQNFRERDYFANPLRDLRLESLYVSPPFRTVINSFVINLSVIIPDQNGSFNGVIAASLDPDYFSVLLSSVLYAKDMRSSITHGDGIVFMIMPEIQGAAGTKQDVPGSLFTRHIKSGTTSNVLTGTSIVGDGTRIIAMRTFNPPQLKLSRPLVIGVSRDRDTILADWWQDTLLKSSVVAAFNVFLLFGTFLLQGRQKKLEQQGQQILQEQINAQNESSRVKELQNNNFRLGLLQEVSQHQATTVQELLDFSLEKVIALTESSIGYIYHYSEEEKQFVLNTWSKNVMASCSVTEPQSVYHLDKTGLWGDVVRQRCPIMVNDYEAPSDLKKGYPEGHVPLSRFLSIPVFDKERIVAVVGVANKIAPYDQTDKLQLTLMMDGVWKIATRLTMEEQISRAVLEWQTTFDSISDSISLIDADQRILRCNKATCTMLGSDYADIIDQPCWQLFHGTDSPVSDCPMQRAKHSRASETSTIQHGDRWLEVSVDPVLSNSGELISAVHIVRDVTESVNLVHQKQEINDLFRLFMKHSPVYTFIKEVTDTESRVLQASDNFCDMTGTRTENMVGKTMHQLFPNEFADKVTADDLQVVTSRKVVQLEESLNDGTYITYKFPIENADGRRIIAGYTIDITERKQLEKDLRKQTSVISGVLESTNSAIFSVDTSCRYTSFNTSHKKIMKNLYNADIHIGDVVTDFMNNEDAAIAKANLYRTLAGEAFVLEADSGDSTLIRSVFEISHNPIRDSKGVVEGAAIFARDISEERRSEGSLREMQAQLMQSDKMATIGQLAAGVAHEINNPMGFVSSNMVTLAKYVEKYNRYIELLENEVRSRSNETMPEHLMEAQKTMKLDYIFRDINVLLDESNEGIERVKRIVRDLRTFSRAETTELVSADLNGCMDSTINIVINEIKYAAELYRSYGELPKVPCNVQQISQVFMNLLINAAHAIQSKSDAVGEIVIRTWCDEKSAFVSVSDTGCGITPENCSKIFDAFFTTKDVGMGTGLGLSISAGIIHKHGGDITVTSEVGTGSVFTVRLPLKSALCGNEVTK